MAMGKEREVVEDGRPGFEIIIAYWYAEMDDQQSDHLLGLNGGSVRDIMEN
jgi:hypothetical protein